MPSPTDPSTHAADDEGWEPLTDALPFADVHPLDRIELMTEVTHPVRGRVLRLLRRPLTVAQLAERLDVPVTRLYHHLHKLEAAGLAAVVATRRVGAVTERRYRASAAAYSIPSGVLKDLDPLELSTALGSVFDLARLDFQRGIEHGSLLDLLGSIETDGSDGDPDASIEVVLSLESLRLDDDRRRELAQRLHALLTEFADDDGEHPVTTFVASFPSA